MIKVLLNKTYWAIFNFFKFQKLNRNCFGIISGIGIKFSKIFLFNNFILLCSIFLWQMFIYYIKALPNLLTLKIRFYLNTYATCFTNFVYLCNLTILIHNCIQLECAMIFFKTHLCYLPQHNIYSTIGYSDWRNVKDLAQFVEVTT